MTNGLSSELSDEFKQELDAIRSEYDNGTFASFSVDPLGADELVELLNRRDQRERTIDADIRIKYDANNPSLIRYHSDQLSGVVCTAPATEIARLVNDDATGAIFDSNIRSFLGTRGAVNADIIKTCSNSDTSYLFWFLNNGITIVCDRFDPVTDPDNPIIKITNLQIVNGCQTATTIALAEQNGELASDTQVLLRIYETSDPALVSKIVLTTNNQNRINTRDLRANDQVQIDMEQGFAIYNFLYERKPHQYDSTDVDVDRIVPNELVAQAYLAIALRTPSDARRRKYKVWGEFYDRIFAGGPIEPYLVMVQLVTAVNGWLKSNGHTTSNDDVKRKIAKNGKLHIARITSFLWRGNDEWRVPSEKLQAQLAEVSQNPEVLESAIEQAWILLVRIVVSNEHYLADLDSALKSYFLDNDIDRALYAQQT